MSSGDGGRWRWGEDGGRGEGGRWQVTKVGDLIWEIGEPNSILTSFYGSKEPYFMKEGEIKLARNPKCWVKLTENIYFLHSF